MPTTDRLEMLVNLDESQARTQVAGLERRGLTMPLGLEGGRAGGRMPGGVRGLRGLGGFGGGRAGRAGGLMMGGGADGMIVGGGFLAGQIFDALTAKGGPSWGQVIASGAAALGMGLMAVPSPYGITQIAGALLIAGAYLGPKIWDYLQTKTGAVGGYDLAADLKRFEDILRPPSLPIGEDKVIQFNRPFGFFGEDSAAPQRDELDEMTAEMQHTDVLRKLSSIQSLLGRLVLQGNL